MEGLRLIIRLKEEQIEKQQEEASRMDASRMVASFGFDKSKQASTSSTAEALEKINHLETQNK